MRNRLQSFLQAVRDAFGARAFPADNLDSTQIADAIERGYIVRDGTGLRLTPAALAFTSHNGG